MAALASQVENAREADSAAPIEDDKSDAAQSRSADGEHGQARDAKDGNEEREALKGLWGWVE